MTPTNGNDDSSEQSSSTNDGAAEIARRAYEKWLARGCPEGDDRRDWYEAEQEILAANAARPKASERARSRKRATP